MTSDADEEHLKRLSTIIDDRIASLGPKAVRAASPAQLLAVVALGLADDLLLEEKRRLRLEERTRKTIQNAIERIDRRLEADAQMVHEVDRV